MQRLLRFSTLTRPCLCVCNTISQVFPAASHLESAALPPAASHGSGVRSAKWNASPLSNPWGPATGRVLRKAGPKPPLKKGGKAPRLGSSEWRRHRRKLREMKDGVTVRIFVVYTLET